jgi:hypothetical protein
MDPAVTTGLVCGAVGALPGIIASLLTLQNRATLAELENKIVARINGTYVRAGECALREASVAEKLQLLHDRDSERIKSLDQRLSVTEERQDDVRGRLSGLESVQVNAAHKGA